MKITNENDRGFPCNLVDAIHELHLLYELEIMLFCLIICVISSINT